MRIYLFMSKFKLKWHFFQLGYHELLLQGCLDFEIKNKLRRKISYHKMKISNPC
jgi:hypothetical protein